MKKVITLLFFAGLVSTSFAQSGHHQKDNAKNNGNSYQSPRSGNSNFGDAKTSHNKGGRSNDQWNKRGNGHGYSHDSYRENWNRHNEREGHHGYHKSHRNDSYRNSHRRTFSF